MSIETNKIREKRQIIRLNLTKTKEAPPQPFHISKKAKKRSVSADQKDSEKLKMEEDVYQKSVRQPLSIDNFSFIMIVGAGSFGRVWKTQHTRSGAQYAIKVLEKTK